MSSSFDLEATRKNLIPWFASRIPGADSVNLSSLTMPGAGSSNETFFVDLEVSRNGVTNSESLVIRWQPQGFLVFPKQCYDMEQQFQLQRALLNTAVPVPEVLWVEESPAIIGAPFYIMRRVSGWVPGDFPPYHTGGKLFDASDEQKRAAWNAAIDTIVKIHNINWQTEEFGFLNKPSGKQFMYDQVTFWQRVAALNSDPMPSVLIDTRDWLLDNSFEPEHLCLCWGDARLGNLMYQEFDVAAALDWEMACIGDPEADLAWFLHVDWASSTGKPFAATPRLAGLPSMAETLSRYESLTGRKVRHFDYYDAFAAWRLAIVYTRVEQDEKYLARSGNKKGLLTTTHFEKLTKLIS